PAYPGHDPRSLRRLRPGRTRPGLPDRVAAGAGRRGRRASRTGGRIRRCGPQVTGGGRTEAGAAAYARAWAAAAAGANGYLPLSGDETIRLLHGLTLRLVDALQADEFTLKTAYDVGVALVDAHLTDPSLLDRTLRLLGTDFLRYFDAPHATERLARIQGGLAAGYVAALRQRTLAEQERLSMAVLDTRKQAEAALRASERRLRALR